jgi:hypothetical protein
VIYAVGLRGSGSVYVRRRKAVQCCQVCVWMIEIGSLPTPIVVRYHRYECVTPKLSRGSSCPSEAVPASPLPVYLVTSWRWRKGAQRNTISPHTRPNPPNQSQATTPWHNPSSFNVHSTTLTPKERPTNHLNVLLAKQNKSVYPFSTENAAHRRSYHIQPPYHPILSADPRPTPPPYIRLIKAPPTQNVRSLRARTPKQLPPRRTRQQSIRTTRRNNRHIRQCAGSRCDRPDRMSSFLLPPSPFHQAQD